MAKPGPASSYKPEFCSLARKFCLLGATNPELAQMFEVAQFLLDLGGLDLRVGQRPALVEREGGLKSARDASRYHLSELGAGNQCEVDGII